MNKTDEFSKIDKIIMEKQKKKEKTIEMTVDITKALKDDGLLSVLEQIKATKQRLEELEELKKLRIAEKKKELELLEQ